MQLDKETQEKYDRLSPEMKALANKLIAAMIAVLLEEDERETE